jgi:hypothetical protein
MIWRRLFMAHLPGGLGLARDTEAAPVKEEIGALSLVPSGGRDK